jgi:hypothetical protein
VAGRHGGGDYDLAPSRWTSTRTGRRSPSRWKWRVMAPASVGTSEPGTTWTGKNGHHEGSGRDSLVFTA